MLSLLLGFWPSVGKIWLPSKASTYHRLLIKKVCSHFMSLEKNENSDSIYLSSISISFLFLSPLGVMSLEGIDCGL